MADWKSSLASLKKMVAAESESKDQASSPPASKKKHKFLTRSEPKAELTTAESTTGSWQDFKADSRKSLNQDSLSSVTTRVSGNKTPLSPTSKKTKKLSGGSLKDLLSAVKEEIVPTSGQAESPVAKKLRGYQYGKHKQTAIDQVNPELVSEPQSKVLETKIDQAKLSQALAELSTQVGIESEVQQESAASVANSTDQTELSSTKSEAAQTSLKVTPKQSPHSETKSKQSKPTQSAKQAAKVAPTKFKTENNAKAAKPESRQPDNAKVQKTTASKSGSKSNKANYAQASELVSLLLGSFKIPTLSKHRWIREVLHLEQELGVFLTKNRLEQVLTGLGIEVQTAGVSTETLASVVQLLTKLNLDFLTQSSVEICSQISAWLSKQTALAVLKLTEKEISFIAQLCNLSLQYYQFVQQRNAQIPREIIYAEDLPVSQQIDKIRQLLLKNQVVVVAGDTGSGKTTQIPKLCLELGFSQTGLIGHTQPRRIAASSVATRIAQELNSPLGELVGYKVRFNDQVSERTHLKLMTDGILLAEMQSDPKLRQYSCLIIDEAHERSLNNDFILGYLKHILKSRPDLKVIITSATIDVERFSKHFNNCPIIEIEGRTFPVEVRYRPLTLDNFASDQTAFANWQEEEEEDFEQILSYGSQGKSQLASKLNELVPTTIAPTETTSEDSAAATMEEQLAAELNSSTATNSVEKKVKASNLAADETFGLPTSNPYASSSTSSPFVSRRQSARKQEASIFASAPTAPASSPTNQTTVEPILSSSVHQYPALATEAELALQAPAVKAPTRVKPEVGFGSSAKDRQAFRDYQRFADEGSLGLELHQGIIAACEELLKEGRGDILVFLSGEREIHDVASELIHHFSRVNHRYPGLRVLPLYSRLSSAEQQLIFKPEGNIRIILATNIAETSLTVPGIKYVIDAGTARISRYNYKTQIQGLPIEAISQASANQRKGRCGRTSPGICIRLYSEADFEQRPQFTDPEIRRTNLSAVILKMLDLGLPDIANFPLLDAPETSYIRNGLKLLEQLQAIRQQDKHWQITPLGKKIASLPVDPRIGRMIIAAAELGSLNEMLIIAAALTIVDVREYPTGKLAQAQQMHAEYRDERSDYSTLLNLWNFLTEQKLSNNQFRKLCKKRYLNYLRVREWQDLYQQLRLAVTSLKLRLNQIPANYAEIHQAMIPGSLDHIAQLDSNQKQQYKGARGRTFKFFPTSAVAKKAQKWVLVSEIIHLSTTYALRGAMIEPEWIEPFAGHLLKYSYADPHWSQKRNEVIASMSANLFGLTIVERRPVSYGQVDPELCHQLFIRQALVEQQWQVSYPFYHHNNKVIAQALKVEEQQRTRGLVISDEELYQWYAARIPKNIINSASFRHWWIPQERKDPNYLTLQPEQLLKETAEQKQSYPEYLQDGRFKLRLSYVFNPKLENDGVTVLIPIQYLQNLDYRLYQWHIANFRKELVEELIRALPKRLRKQLIPAPDYAQAFMERVPQILFKANRCLSFYQVLSQVFKEINGSHIEAEEWQQAHALLPAHLRLHFRVLDLHNETLATGDNLEELQEKLAQQSQEIINNFDAQQLKTATIYMKWDFVEFGKEESLVKNGVLLDSFPALVPVLQLPAEQRKLLKPAIARAYQNFVLGDTATKTSQEVRNSISNNLANIASGVIVQNLATKAEQVRMMKAGIIDLLLLSSENPIQYLQNNLPNRAKLALYFSGNVQLIIAECIRCASQHIFEQYNEAAKTYSLQKRGLTAAEMIAQATGNNAGITESKVSYQRQAGSGVTDEQFIWDQHYFDFMLDKMRGEINDTTYQVAQIVERILVLANQVNKQLKQHKDLSVILALNDLKAQVASFTQANFVAEHEFSQLEQVPRYLEGMLLRLEKMGQNPVLDQRRQAEVNEVEELYQQLKANYPHYRNPKLLKELFFMIQELRMSLFAQAIGSKITVSAKRVKQFIEQIKENQL